MKAASYFIGVHGVPPKAVRQKNKFKGERSPGMIYKTYYNPNYNENENIWGFLKKNSSRIVVCWFYEVINTM